MTSLGNCHSKILLVLSLASLILSLNFNIGDSEYNFMKSLCSSTTFKQTTSYKSNLSKLLSVLPNHANQSSNNGYFATNSTTLGQSGSEIIYSLFLCRGDTTPDDCERCVSTAITNLPPQDCRNAKSAVIWYDKCMVRYSNESFIATVDDNVKLGWKNNETDLVVAKDDANKCMRLGCFTLFDLAMEISLEKVKPGLSRHGDRKYYSTRDVKYNSTVRIHTMAQCTPDLSPADCGRCLRRITAEISIFCGDGSKNVRMLNPSCNTRCEIYQVSQIETKGISKRKWSSLLYSLPIASTSILLCCGVWICMRSRRAMHTTNVEVYELKKAMDYLQFDFKEIQKATHNFAIDNKLGEGEFGEVYKGKLDNGQVIAVKRLSEKSRQGNAKFKAEVVLVAKLQHKNLVKLSGFCVALKEKILVYEFLPNSSLDRFLYDPIKKASLDWKTRFKIICGIARGLLYLHEDSPHKVIHRDLKASNILLDQDMNPKISDFGLAKLFGANQTQGDTNRIVGTYGYMAPEYAVAGHYSVKSDIYSFGVIILEILSGQKNNFSQGFQLEEEALIHRAWRLWIERKAFDLVDATLDNFQAEEIIKCIHIGLLCIQDCALERPKMSLIIAALNGQTISFPHPKQPQIFGRSKFDDYEVYSQPNIKYAFTGPKTITDMYPRD